MRILEARKESLIKSNVEMKLALRQKKMQSYGKMERCFH